MKAGTFLFALLVAVFASPSFGGALLENGNLFHVWPAQPGYPETISLSADLLRAIQAAKKEAKEQGWDVESYDRISISIVRNDIVVELSRSGNPTVLSGGVMLVLSKETLLLKEIGKTF